MDQIPKPIFYKKLNQINWIKIYAREYGVGYSEMAILCLSPRAKYHIPSPSVDQIIIPEANNTAFYIDAHSWKKLVESLNNEYTSRLTRLEKYEKDFERDGHSYLDFAKKISRANFENLSNKDLLSLYLTYQDRLFTYSVFAWTAFILNNFVAERASEIIAKCLRSQNKMTKKQEVLSSLFQPVKQATVIKLQREVEKYHNRLPKNKFNQLYKSYKWLSCLDLHNDPWTEDQFKEAINAFKKQPLKKKRPFKKYADELMIKKEDINYLLMAQRFIYIKDARDDFRRQGVYHVLPFFAEIAKRMKIGTKDITYAKSAEIINFLKNNQPTSCQTLNERKKAFVMYLDDQSNIVCLQGKAINQALNKFKLVNKKKVIKEIKGTVASRGKVTGTVVIVHGIKDLPKVKSGSILVAVTTHPDYTIAMRRASAIITDEGGITSHAAIVSREYGIPCIVGTENATKILKDEDKVEIDAEKGIVRVIG